MTESGASQVGPSGDAPAAATAEWRPHVVGLVCNWCSYAGADMAGTTRLEYPANVRLLRFPCTGRMSPLMIVRAFELGADGVLVSGCHPGDCHYVQGNLVARRRFGVFRSLMDFLGIDLRRLHFAWVSAAEGHKWARVVREVTASVQEAGPLPRFSSSDSSDVPELPALPDASRSELSPDQLEPLREHLRRAASELLASKRVDMVIGFRRGSLPGQMAPTTVRTPEEAAQLDWGQGCLCNLAAYLPTALAGTERVALVVKRCDVGAVEGLVREAQAQRDRLVLIGVPCPGVRAGAGLEAKCLSCDGDVAAGCDLVVGPEGVREGSSVSPGDVPRTPDPRDEQVAYLESLPGEQRFRFWQRQFARCLRCYACRAACPLCYCTSCISEKHRPQWISPLIDNRGNTAWNIVRAFHLAGRCTGCDECARVCPADIRLDLINRKLALEMQRQFASSGPEAEQRSALAGFRMDDPDGFIL